MAQDTSGVNAVLSRAWAYDLAQGLMGGSRTRRWLQEEFIQARAGERVLDVGCGTADILAVLLAVDYVGFDISDAYIRRANDRWSARGRFFASPVTRATLAPHGAFDLILAAGLLHHLGDDEVRSLFDTLLVALKPTGRIVTVDCCYAEDQHRVAKFLIDRDRGKKVRTPDAYASLAREAAAGVHGWLVHRTWVPYTYWIMRVRQGGAPLDLRTDSSAHGEFSLDGLTPSPPHRTTRSTIADSSGWDSINCHVVR